MTELTLTEKMEDLVSAEEFLEFFGIEYDPKVVHVNRLHILQRFHNYIQQGKDQLPDENNEEALKNVYIALLTRAYQDFVDSDAVTEKVFKVFQQGEPQTTFVSVDMLES